MSHPDPDHLERDQLRILHLVSKRADRLEYLRAQAGIGERRILRRLSELLSQDHITIRSQKGGKHRVFALTESGWQRLENSRMA